MVAMSTRGVRVAGLAVAASLALAGLAPARAQDVAGAYDFTSSARGAGGKPACVERWILWPNGDFLLVSGQEQVRGAWRLERDVQSGAWLAWTRQTTNQRPDCYGRKAPKRLKDERTAFYFNGNGDLVVSRSPVPTADGPIRYQPFGILRRSTDEP
jgi:hypothetical protein